MKTKKGFAFLLAAALLLTACGKTDNASQADAPPPAETQDSAQTGETPPSPAENAESALTPTESADSSSVSENDNYVIETHGSREYDGAAASDDFADALFIGDSRTVGLMLNGDKPKADYFATAGLNVMTAQTTPVVPKKDFAEFLTEQAYTDYGWGDDTWGGDTWTDYGWDDGGWTGGDSTQWDWGYTDPAAEPDSSEDTSSAEEDLMTIPEALKFKQYKRIFLNFGVNELGWPYPDVFVERYKLLILQVRSAQPDAQIYVESMLPVSYLAYSIDTCYTTANVDNFNENYVRRAAEETNCIYMDVNQFFRDSRGDLFFEASTDGIHLTRDYCMEWMDILSYYTVGGGDISILSRRHELSSEADSAAGYPAGGEGYDNSWSDWSDEGGYGDYTYGYDDYGYDDYGYGDYGYGDYDYGYGY